MKTKIICLIHDLLFNGIPTILSYSKLTSGMPFHSSNQINNM